MPDIHEIAAQVRVLEERMNTVQAEYRTDIARLAEDMAKRDAFNTRLLLGILGTVVAAAIGVFGIWLQDRPQDTSQPIAFVPTVWDAPAVASDGRLDEILDLLKRDSENTGEPG